MKIIGTGLLASGFQENQLDINFEGHLIFASGVSNSLEINDNLFQREINLLVHSISVHHNKKIIYFSSTSICGNNSKYAMHKRDIEKIIKKSAKKYLIIRCPQVVGPTLSRTLVSSFVDQIYKGKLLEIQKYAKRDLIDINDVVRLTSVIANLTRNSNLIINLCTGNQIPAVKIAEEIASILGKNLNIKLIDRGDSLISDASDLRKYINKDDIIFNENYWKKVIKKNVPLVIKKIKLNENLN